jgi:hypothetical protein
LILNRKSGDKNGRTHAIESRHRTVSAPLKITTC